MVWPAPAVENGHKRDLATVFGTVQVTRMAYRARQAVNLYPGDAVLNLAAGKHPHGLRRLAAVEAARGSFHRRRDGDRTCHRDPDRQALGRGTHPGRCNRDVGAFSGGNPAAARPLDPVPACWASSETGSMRSTAKWSPRSSGFQLDAYLPHTRTTLTRRPTRPG